MKWDVTDNGAALSVSTQPVGAEGYFGIKIPVANVNLTSSTVLSCEMKITQKNKVYMTTIGFDNDNHLFYSRWCSYDWEKDWSAPYPAQPMPQMRLTIELMQKLISSLPNVDTKRIYVGGQSMGGFGTWEIVTRQSNMFACAAPSAGGGDKSQAAVIKSLPIRCAHSTNDPIVKSRWTTQMVDALKQAGSNVELTLFDGNDHMCDDEFWTNELVDWFFSHTNPGYAVSTSRALKVSRVNTAGMRSGDALFDLLGRVHVSSNVINKVEYAPKITLLIDTKGNKTLVVR
jgi:hypothetical protein